MAQDRKDISRREFSVAAALAALSGVAITISACGGGGSPTNGGNDGGGGTGGGGTGGGGTGGSGDRTGVVGANHGHTAVITAAQLTAANAIALDIRGQADHPHTVELTAGEIANIAANQRVSKVSSSEMAHAHTVTFN
jgi:hypothetical protein